MLGSFQSFHGVPFDLRKKKDRLYTRQPRNSESQSRPIRPIWQQLQFILQGHVFFFKICVIWFKLPLKVFECTHIFKSVVCQAKCRFLWCSLKLASIWLFKATTHLQSDHAQFWKDGLFLNVCHIATQVFPPLVDGAVCQVARQRLFGRFPLGGDFVQPALVPSVAGGARAGWLEVSII